MHDACFGPDFHASCRSSRAGHARRRPCRTSWVGYNEPLAAGVWPQCPAFSSLKESGTPTAAVDDQITLAHLAVMLGQRDLACQMLEIANDLQRLKFFPLTKLWKEYAKGFLSLCRGEPFSPADLKLKGYEKYWMPYLALMSAVTNKLDVASACSAIDESFVLRNRDKRLIDWEMIDGDGSHPVQWDFRKFTLLHFSG